MCVDIYDRVRVNKEALRNSARAVIDQCKGIMAERKLIDLVSQPVKPVDFDDGFIFFVFIANGK